MALLGLVLVLGGIVPRAQAAGFGIWGALHPVPTAYSIQDMIWNADLSEYLAVGEGGAILTSTDGSTWTRRTANAVQKLYGVLWDGSQYVAVGEGGIVLTSPDGVNWTSHDTNQRKALFDIAWNGSVYVAVGQEGVVLSSPDLDNWTVRSPGTGATLPVWEAVVWNPNAGLFAAVGSTRSIITSPDGATWTVSERGNLDGEDITYATLILEDVVSDGNGFVVVGQAAANGYPGYILHSPTGAAGSWGDPVQIVTTRGLNAVTESGGTFFAVGDGVPADPDVASSVDVPSIVLASSDGITWTPMGNGITSPASLKTVVGDGTGVNFLAAGVETIAITGDSGANWTELSPAAAETLNDLISDGSLFIGVGDNGTILTSSDGNNWSAQTSTTMEHLHAVAAGSAQYVAVGDNATILVSADGATWAAATGMPGGLAGTEALRGIVYTGAANGYVVVGDAGTVLTSTDGNNWTLEPAPTSNNLNAIAVKTGVLVAVGDLGTLRTRAVGGSSWTTPTTTGLGALNLQGVAAGNGLFMAVGDKGLATWSADGSTWTSTGIGTTATLRDVAWGGTQFMVAGDKGTISGTADGSVWTALFSGTTVNLNALAYDAAGARFLAAGAGATILGSGGVDLAVDLVPPAKSTVDNDQTKLVFNLANIANLDAVDVVFESQLPPELSFVSAVVPGATCALASDGVTVQCPLGTLSGGGSNYQITITVKPTVDGTFTVSGTVSEGASADTVPANNSISAPIVVEKKKVVLQNPDTQYDKNSGIGALGLWSLALLAPLAARRRRSQV